MDTKAVAQNKWGRARFGGSQTLLLLLSILGGIVISAVIACLIVQFGPEAPVQRKVLAAVIAAIIMLPVAFALCWLIMLDRDTLAGAVKDPDSSIEGRWLEKAGFSTLGDIVAVAGLAATALTIFKVDIPASNALLVVVGLAFVDMAIRYLMLKKVEG